MTLPTFWDFFAADCALDSSPAVVAVPVPARRDATYADLLAAVSARLRSSACAEASERSSCRACEVSVRRVRRRRRSAARVVAITRLLSAASPLRLSSFRRPFPRDWRRRRPRADPPSPARRPSGAREPAVVERWRAWRGTRATRIATPGVRGGASRLRSRGSRRARAMPQGGCRARRARGVPGVRGYRGSTLCPFDGWPARRARTTQRGVQQRA